MNPGHFKGVLEWTVNQAINCVDGQFICKKYSSGIGTCFAKPAKPEQAEVIPFHHFSFCCQLFIADIIEKNNGSHQNYP
jgi:hypothetical protein